MDWLLVCVGVVFCDFGGDSKIAGSMIAGLWTR
jgi:hypothetical protein